MEKIRPFSKMEAIHTRRLQNDGNYNTNRRTEILIHELWGYVLYLEKEIEKLQK